MTLAYSSRLTTASSADNLLAAVKQRKKVMFVPAMLNRCTDRPTPARRVSMRLVSNLISVSCVAIRSAVLSWFVNGPLSYICAPVSGSCCFFVRDHPQRSDSKHVVAAEFATIQVLRERLTFPALNNLIFVRSLQEQPTSW